jgi:DNA-binding transcriptional MerR regulator
MTGPEAVRDEIIIRHQRIPVRTLELEHERLRFFAENPRVYNLLNAGGRLPTQDEIQAKLLELEHVRVLILDIQLNGGLIDPLIVREGSYEVLEGNSRLAAYRTLAKRDPIKWAKVRCTLLPEDLDEALIFALLGQYHVKGKKAWLPFEQAGFLYRRYKVHHLDLKKLASEIGLSLRTVKHLVETYEFMLANEEPPERWSYYDEYLKSSKIKKARDAQPELDSVIVRKIKAGEIDRAVEIRDELPHICLAPKVLRKLVDGRLSFEDAHEQAVVEAGTDNVHFRRLQRFLRHIIEKEFEAALVQASIPMRKKLVYEIRKIETRLKSLKAKLE